MTLATPTEYWERFDARFLNGYWFYRRLVRARTVNRAPATRTYVRDTPFGRFHLDPQDLGLCRALATKGTREEESVAMLMGLLHPDMNILEIGANIGFYVVLEGSVIKNGRGTITAAEPFPANIRMLKLNVTANALDDRVAIHQCALSDTTAMIPLAVSNHYNLHTLASLIDRHSYRRSLDVQAFTLPDFARHAGFDLTAVDFVRMDVEGAEYIILPSFLPVLKERRTFTMFVEFHPSLNPDGHRRLLTQLHDSGFRCLAATKESRRGGRNVREHVVAPPMRTLYEDAFLLSPGGCETFLRKGPD